MTLTIANIREPAPMKTLSGEEHGLIKVLGNSVPDNDFKRFKEKDRPAMKKQKEEDGKMVKAIYINIKGSDQRLPMTYNKWDGDPLLAYKFIPDQEYEVPKGLVEQVNAKKINKRSGIVGLNGQPMLMDQLVSSEHRFVPVGF